MKLQLLFYFPPDLYRTPETVTYKALAPVGFLAKRNDQESQKLVELVKSLQHTAIQVLKHSSGRSAEDSGTKTVKKANLCS